MSIDPLEMSHTGPLNVIALLCMSGFTQVMRGLEDWSLPLVCGRRPKMQFNVGVGKTENGRVSLFCGASTLEGVFYQSVCVIMGLDSSETWPLVVTLLPGSKTIRGLAAEPQRSCAPFTSRP